MLGLLVGCDFRILVARTEEGRKVLPCSCLQTLLPAFRLLVPPVSNSASHILDPPKSSFRAPSLPAARLPVGTVAGINNLETFL